MSNNEFKALDYEFTSIRMRKLVGFLAFFLPTILLVLPLFNTPSCWQTSISHNYYTSYREIFTGTLIGIGFFMICYKTKNEGNIVKYNIEKYGAVTAGLVAILVAIFPTAPSGVIPDSLCLTNSKRCVDSLQYTLNTNAEILNKTIHSVSAAILFIILAIFSLYVFPSKRAYPKNINIVFWLMGIIIFIGIGICIVAPLFFNYPKGMFLGEMIALYAFGVSWLLKGYLEGKNKSENL